MVNPDPQSKMQAVSLAFIMFAGIIMVGSLFLALVVIWGNRTRRLARTPLPPVAERDELWFLKPSKSADEDADVEKADDNGKSMEDGNGLG